MARTDPNFRLRISEELLNKIKDRADLNFRSTTQEIVVLIETALNNETEFNQMKKAIIDLNKRLTKLEK